MEKPPAARLKRIGQLFLEKEKVDTEIEKLRYSDALGSLEYALKESKGTWALDHLSALEIAVSHYFAADNVTKQELFESLQQELDSIVAGFGKRGA